MRPRSATRPLQRDHEDVQEESRGDEYAVLDTNANGTFAAVNEAPRFVKRYRGNDA